ncbi:hypothetical protein F7734_55925 [Scytonema sp. UIC 10036]|uniref:hypothetical protein n=1 Tax=Scytonema sp. UIC 10036 TaxID=2304196 RepID=UPI0012DAF6C5|nr:hypothetical protein [Scytonema sp. UIC 10036]MUH01068.1 hypothetical protein [Scytonema sp. UIC 10036]
MAMLWLNSGCSAAIVIARRGQGRTEKLPKQNAIYFKKPEDCLKSNVWSRVGRKINICGGFNRHKFYFQGRQTGSD